MNRFLNPITDWVSTKRGMWITIVLWFVVMIALSMGPTLNDYKVANFQSLPDDAQSIIADQKLKEYFPGDQGTPGILVFHNAEGDVAIDNVQEILAAI
ncbi:MAG TPA: MMPL family transporter, partial [Planococcus sp. (in: firmicutes)]|nr:MMPL family transporter [Planococcus sp. (in: firmicutes)]